MIRRISDTDGKRLIILGLDGAGFNYLWPVVKTGRCPNFSRLFAQGTRSDCLSTIPPLTPPAWSTMMTGVNPGKHGIFDFIQPDSKGAFRVVDARSRTRKTFIDHAAAENIRAISILVPYTFPPDENTSGLIISGLGTPSADSDFIRPHSHRDSILTRFPFLRDVDPTVDQSLDTLHLKLLTHTSGTNDLCRYAMREFPDWGLLFAVYSATDLIPHFYSKFFDPDHAEYEPDTSKIPFEFRNALNQIYETIDPFIGKCLDIVNRDGGWVVLVSDHGSQPLTGSIGKDAFLTSWLENNGFLHTGGDEGREKQAKKVQAGSIANKLLYLAKKHTPHGLRNAVNVAFGRQKEAITDKLTAVPFMDDIDWTRTTAFCAPGGYGIGLYINRAGDFPDGIVQQGAEYHKIRDDIVNKLESLMIDESIPLFTRVLRREDAIWGPSTGLAPDLFLLWKDDPILKQKNYMLMDGTSLNPPEVKDGTGLTWCGTHRMEGIFAISGDGIRRGLELTSVPNLADVLPTLNYIAGLEIPSDVDGKIIEEAFQTDFLDRIKPRIGGPDDSGAGPSGGMSSEESDRMLDLLQGLGYLN